MIEIRSLYKTFDRTQVLNGLDLSVREGETKVIIGRSGAGKSVLLKCIMGIIRADTGSIKVAGGELMGLSEQQYERIRRNIGLVFQGGALFDSLDVEENVRFFLDEHTTLAEAVKRERAVRALAMVGLKDIERKMPSELSGGMRKRVSLARVLCMEPRIIFYDEPTSEVDPITAEAINRLIVTMRDKLGVTSIVVTHDMRSAFRVADSVAMFYHGQVIADGTPQQIQACHHPVVRQFINGEAEGPVTDDESMKFGHVR